MANDVKKNYFTTGQMRNALIQIEDQMVHSSWMPSIVLGINRGGCIPGVYLSHRIKTPHEVLDIRLRDHTAKPNLTVLEKAFAYQKKILIIDDIKSELDERVFDLFVELLKHNKNQVIFSCIEDCFSSKITSEFNEFKKFHVEQLG